MSTRGQELSQRLQGFIDELRVVARELTDEDWKKVLDYEQWSIGVTMRHMAAGHLGIAPLARMIINGEKLPDITIEGLIEMANQHAREHADCTKEEVMEILEKNASDVVSFAAGLSDEELDRTGHLAATGEVSAQQIIEFVVFSSAGEHLANVKKALGMAVSG